MALSDREDFLLSLSSFLGASVLARLGVIYLPHSPPQPGRLLIISLFSYSAPYAVGS